MRRLGIGCAVAGALVSMLLVSCGGGDGSSSVVPQVARITVARGASTPAAGSISPSAIRKAVLQIRVTGDLTEAVRVTQMRFTETGTANMQTAFTEMGLYVDVNGDGVFSPSVDTVTLGIVIGGYASDDTALFTGLDRTIYAGSSENWLLVYTLAGTAAAGGTFLPTLAATSDVTAASTSTGIGAQVAGVPVTGFAQTVQTVGALAISAALNNPAAGNLPYPTTSVPMLQLRLVAGSTENVRVTSLKITATGTGDANADVTAAQLYNDADGSGTVTGGDTPIGGSQTFSGGTATFSGLTEVINSGAGGAETWLLACSFSGGTGGDTYAMHVQANADVSAVGVTSALAVATTGAPVTGNVKTLPTPGTLTLALATSNPAGGGLPQPPINVPMLLVRLRAGATENVNVSSIRFTAGGTGDANTDIVSVSLYNDLDQNGQISAGDVQIGSPVTVVANQATFSGLTESIASTSTTGESWLVVCSFGASGSLGDSYRMSLAANADVTATGAVSGIPIVPTGAPINGNDKTRMVGALALAPGSNNPASGNLPSTPTNVATLQVRLTAAAENVVVASIVVTASGSGSAVNDISSVSLYNDLDATGTLTGGDTQIGTSTVFTGSPARATFSSLAESVTAGPAGAENWIVVCTWANGNLGSTYAVSVAANADVTASGGTSSAGITPTGAPVSGGSLALVTVPPVVVTTDRLPRARTNVYYSVTLQRSGGQAPFTWSVSAGVLPVGLSLNGSTGVINGTPAGTGGIFTVRVTDSSSPTAQTDTQALGFEVDPLGATIISVISTGGGAYTSVGQAVANLPNPLNTLAIIEIQDNATYTENVTLTYTAGTVPGIILRARYDCTPLLQAASSGSDVVTISNNNIAVENLRITGASGAGACGVQMAAGLWNVAVRNCVIYGNDIAIDNGGSPGTTIVNNTCYGPNGLYVGGGASCTVQNNIVWATGGATAWCHREYATPSTNCDFNLYYAPSAHVGFDGTTYYTTLGAWQVYSLNDAGSASGNPNLVNPAGGDFHLTSSSTLALDGGTTPFNLFTDAEAYARNQGSGWDIGAYEYH